MLSKLTLDQWFRQTRNDPSLPKVAGKAMDVFARAVAEQKNTVYKKVSSGKTISQETIAAKIFKPANDMLNKMSKPRLIEFSTIALGKWGLGLVVANVRRALKKDANLYSIMNYPTTVQKKNGVKALSTYGVQTGERLVEIEIRDRTAADAHIHSTDARFARVHAATGVLQTFQRTGNTVTPRRNNSAGDNDWVDDTGA